MLQIIWFNRSCSRWKRGRMLSQEQGHLVCGGQSQKQVPGSLFSQIVLSLRKNDYQCQKLPSDQYPLFFICVLETRHIYYKISTNMHQSLPQEALKFDSTGKMQDSKLTLYKVFLGYFSTQQQLLWTCFSLHKKQEERESGREEVGRQQAGSPDFPYSLITIPHTVLCIQIRVCI